MRAMVRTEDRGQLLAVKVNGREDMWFREQIARTTSGWDRSRGTLDDLAQRERLMFVLEFATPRISADEVTALQPYIESWAQRADGSSPLDDVGLAYTVDRGWGFNFFGLLRYRRTDSTTKTWWSNRA